MTTKTAALTLALAATLGLALAGCSSSTASDAASGSVATPSAATSAAASTSVAASPSSTATPEQQWCQKYTVIATRLSQMTGEKDNSIAALPAVVAFDQLWADAATAGYLTEDESAANRRAVAAFKAVVSLIAAGSAQDSADVKKAQADMLAVTKKDDALLRSTDTKVAALCAVPGSSASPAPSVSGSGSAGAQASVAPSASPASS